MALQPQSSGRPSVPVPPLLPTRRLGDALQSIQDEHNRLLAERDTLRHELARTQNLGEQSLGMKESPCIQLHPPANEQDVELNLIRRAIWNLQNQLENHRLRFEEERRKLFDELRQQRAAAGLAPPSPLRELSNPPPLSASTSSHSMRQILEDRPELTYDRKMKGRAREPSELDQDDDYREPKRVRSSDSGGHRGQWCKENIANSAHPEFS